MLNRLLESICFRVPSITKKYLSGKGFVFMLHRVLPNEENKYYWNEGLAITPDGIKKWAEYFRKKGFDLVSMDEALLRINDKNAKKFIAFTLDDGYKDNLKYGLPAFEALNLPCTIYIANCFPNNKAIYWWYFLEEYLKHNNQIDLHSIGISFSKSYTKEKAKEVYNEVRELLRRCNYEIHVKFATEICGVEDLEQLNKDLNLTWDEVRTLNDHPLITIGGHTINHVSIKNQSIKVIENEIIAGTKELEKEIKTPVKHFAFPYGSLDDVEAANFEVLRKMNYNSAVLNHPGSIFEHKENEYFAIPRMGLSDDTSEERINNLFCGKVHLNLNGLKKVIL